MNKELMQWAIWGMVLLMGFLWWSRRSANRRKARGR
jgi:hypothetical protein